jgi:hypothetical protein
MWPPLCSSGQSSWIQNGDILCFLWGTNWIYICYVEESRPPLRSSGQNSFLEEPEVWVRFPGLQDFLNLVSTTEELLERKSSSGLQCWEYGSRGSAELTTRHIRKSLALTSPKNGGGSICIVRSRTQVTEFVVCFGGECSTDGVTEENICNFACNIYKEEAMCWDVVPRGKTIWK